MSLEQVYETDTRLVRFTLCTEAGVAIEDAAEVAIRLYSGGALAEERLLSTGQVANDVGGSYSARFGPLAAGYYVVTATGTSAAGDIKSERLALLSVALAPQAVSEVSA